jgi:ribosomal protein L11 methyltransferase
MKHWPALRVRFTPATSTDLPAVQDLVAAALDDLRPTAVQESDAEWLVFFASPQDREHAAATLPANVPGAVALDRLDVPDDDWAARSQQDMKPVRVGRITIAPPWEITAAGGAGASAPSAENGAALTILIQPSMGFGTGHHASTRLCTALLQHLDLSGKTALDVGTGSGILALVARALGARSVLAVDDDADAIAAAAENLELNGGMRTGIELRVADFRSLPSAPADVVTANLTGGLLVRGAAWLAGAVAPGGSLIISGVLAEEEADVLAAFAPFVTLVERLSEDEWIGARLSRQR